jgi:hypothetical protein
MPITFESLSSSLGRLSDVIKSIPDLLRDPSANPLQSGILLGIFVTLVLIVLVSVVLSVVRPSYYEDDELSRSEDSEEEPGQADQAVAPARPMSRLTVASIVILALVAVWVVAGVTTSNSAVCLSCHVNTVHKAAKPNDPHANVSCVDCHETGGPVARVTVNVATRIEHFILAQNDPKHVTGYGRPVASDGCLSCHGSQISSTYYNRAQGVRVSHKEPLASGAQCVDCHALASGVVNSTTVGMAPCLRCHDGKTAKATCSLCHTGDPALAIRSTVATGGMASVLVPNPQCGTCHTDMSKCNACHGIAMPHSADFMAYGHARVAAIEIWNNGSAKVCVKCHYPGHNSCQAPGCHTAPFPAHPSPAWRTLHTVSPWSGAQTDCSCHKWNPWDHNGETFCEICHATKPANAKP